MKYQNLKLVVILIIINNSNNVKKLKVDKIEFDDNCF